METKILLHTISWHLIDNTTINELDESSIEHIEHLIKEGISQGELIIHEGDTMYRGWWKILFNNL